MFFDFHCDSFDNLTGPLKIEKSVHFYCPALSNSFVTELLKVAISTQLLSPAQPPPYETETIKCLMNSTRGDTTCIPEYGLSAHTLQVNDLMISYCQMIDGIARKIIEDLVLHIAQWRVASPSNKRITLWATVDPHKYIGIKKLVVDHLYHNFENLKKHYQLSAECTFLVNRQKDLDIIRDKIAVFDVDLCFPKVPSSYSF